MRDGIVPSRPKLSLRTDITPSIADQQFQPLCSNVIRPFQFNFQRFSQLIGAFPNAQRRSLASYEFKRVSIVRRAEFGLDLGWVPVDRYILNMTQAVQINNTVSTTH